MTSVTSCVFSIGLLGGDLFKNSTNGHVIAVLGTVVIRLALSVLVQIFVRRKMKENLSVVSPFMK